jgi:Mn2+/Fe2+ NRAMP family transporter
LSFTSYIRASASASVAENSAPGLCVVLSFQLPFAMVPLVRFAGSRRLMGDFVLAGAWKTAVWFAVFLVIGFNVLLLLQVAGLIHG